MIVDTPAICSGFVFLLDLCQKILEPHVFGAQVTLSLETRCVFFLICKSTCNDATFYRSHLLPPKVIKDFNLKDKWNAFQ